MASNIGYVDKTKLSYFNNKLKTFYAGNIDVSRGTDNVTINLRDKLNSQTALSSASIAVADASNAGVMSTALFNKLNGIDLSNYYTKSQTYSQAQTDAKILELGNKIEFIYMQTLPAVADAERGKIYLVPASQSTSQNVKDEYVVVNLGTSQSPSYAWEKIGSTAVDLSNYVTKDSAQTITGEKTFNRSMLLGSVGSVGFNSADGSVFLKTASNDAEVYVMDDDGDTSVMLLGKAGTSFKVGIGNDRYNIYHSGNLTSQSAASSGTAVSLVTTGEKYTWNNKGTYTKPSGGIPKTDLASAVQTSLGLADTAIQDISMKLNTSDVIETSEIDAMFA